MSVVTILMLTSIESNNSFQINRSFLFNNEDKPFPHKADIVRELVLLFDAMECQLVSEANLLQMQCKANPISSLKYWFSSTESKGLVRFYAEGNLWLHPTKAI